MPFPATGYDSYILGPVKSATASQLPPAHLNHYMFDLQVGSANARNPFPLRAHVSGDKPPIVSHPATQSILSGRRSPRVEQPLNRLDSLEDGVDSAESDENESPTVTLVLRDPPRRHFRRKAGPSVSTPILKQYESKAEKTRKTVKFADDVGLDLAKTFEFVEEDDDGYWEPEPEPRGDGFTPSRPHPGADDLVVEISEWQVNFSQPAADYLGFRERLDANIVGLENVIIKQKTDSFMGTIKVKNVAFKKDVFVRCTFNSWETYSDFPAKYCGNTDLFDTFSFEIVIPEEAERRHVIEFCVALRTDGKEYWDSNLGKNYQLITGHMKHKRTVEKQTDAYRMESPKGSWGEFASWNQLENVQPYW